MCDIQQTFELQQWLVQLDTIIADQGLKTDVGIQRSRDLIEIELEGMQLNLPALSEETRTSLQQIHVSKVITMMLETLQQALGYYSLPEVKAGDNERPITPELAHQLKTKLMNHEVDMYFAKSKLKEVLDADEDNE